VLNVRKSVKYRFAHLVISRFIVATVLVVKEKEEISEDQEQILAVVDQDEILVATEEHQEEIFLDLRLHQTMIQKDYLQILVQS
jgi:hypothetical protein